MGHPHFFVSLGLWLKHFILGITVATLHWSARACADLKDWKSTNSFGPALVLWSDGLTRAMIKGASRMLAENGFGRAVPGPHLSQVRHPKEKVLNKYL